MRLDDFLPLDRHHPADEARKTGKTHFVASISEPPTLYVLIYGDPEFSKKALSVMLELTPDGQCIRHNKPALH
jgi:hypothetical protein